MKIKLLFLAAVCAFSLASWGGKSACDCQKEATALMEKASKGTNVEKEMDALKKACEKYKEEDFKNCK